MLKSLIRAALSQRLLVLVVAIVCLLYTSDAADE